MASRASNRRFILYVAANARPHIDGPFQADRIHLIHLAVASITTNLRRTMSGVAEEHEIGKLINALRWNFVDHAAGNSRAAVPVAFMAREAHIRGRKTCEFGLQRAHVTIRALKFQRRVAFVAERDRIGAKKSYGNEKATNESEYVLLYLLPPPAAITTNCLPVFLPT